MFTNLLANWRQSFIKRRFPTSDEFALSHRSLFILPTRFGVFLLLTCALLFILGTNYQNNPILIVCYLLLALFLLSIFSCYFNLTSVKISASAIAPVHVKDRICLKLKAEVGKPRYGWCFHYQGTNLGYYYQITDDDTLTLYIDAQERGLHCLEQLVLTTDFPFGLMRCWTYLNFDCQYWVYPASKQGDWQFLPAPNQGAEQSDGTSPNNREADESFDGIKSYVSGESLSRISWKHYAKSPDNQLLSKAFLQAEHQVCWLSLDAVYGDSLEDKLSVLTHACLSQESTNKRYGLSLSSGTVEPANGAKHLQHCLELLALYPSQRSKAK